MIKKAQEANEAAKKRKMEITTMHEVTKKKLQLTKIERETNNYVVERLKLEDEIKIMEEEINQLEKEDEGKFKYVLYILFVNFDFK